VPSVRQPVIMVGTGRCGSTMLHRLVALHEELGWLSPQNEVLPTQTWLSSFSNLYRSERLGARIKHLPFFPKPYEAYRFWEHYLPGFSRRDRPQTAADVPEQGIEPVRAAIERVLRYQRRPRLLAKVTGWSRIAYFDRIFPDALFVHLRREHRAVVSSWIQAGWLDVSSAIDSSSWQWGPVPERYRELWEELGGGPILSAAVKIQLDLDDIRENMKLVPERSYEMRYEDLIDRPADTLRALLDFCGLTFEGAFERRVRQMTFYDPRDKWKRYLTEEQGRLVSEFFERAAAPAS
jgi:Sulfotransferase family